MSTPFLSVIVPAHQGATVLPRSLRALAESDLPRDSWELIVVDDASTDGTASVAAEWADQVVSTTRGPCGPGVARNRGVQASTGEWVVFIDADVVVHPDTIRRFVDVITQNPGIDAVFGAYDDSPYDVSFLSQYRNLLHRYVHLSSAGDAQTFWAGCGAVRRSAFIAVGGFDEHRYPRPQIEDIELGYRLRDRGGRIILNPDVQGTHLKRWTFVGAIRTDLFDRGIPWTRLLLERGGMSQAGNLNLRRWERLKAAFVGMGLALLGAAVILRRPEVALAGGILLLAVLASNIPLFVWFAKRRGVLFALRAVPMNLSYYVVSSLSVAVGFCLYRWKTA